MKNFSDEDSKYVNHIFNKVFAHAWIVILILVASRILCK